MIELYNSVKIKPLHAKFGLPFFIHTIQYRYLQILIMYSSKHCRLSNQFGKHVRLSIRIPISVFGVF